MTVANEVTFYMNSMRSKNLKDFIESNKQYAVKLHLGCGGVRWRDFINVDFHPHEPGVTDSSRKGCIADVFANMRSLGLDASSVDEIFTSHTIDHFTRWEAIDMLKDWYRMLKPKGKLIFEAADFNRCLLWLFHPSRRKRKLARSQFYGNQWDRLEFETHRYVWSSNEIRQELLTIGFDPVKISHKTETHHPGRDMRIVAVK